MTIKKVFFIAICLLTALATTAPALEVPPLAGKRFHNNSTLLKLTEQQTQAVEDKLARFEKDRNGSQMAVLVIDSLEGASLEDFSLRVAEAWKLGQKRSKGGDGDNGLLLTVVIKDKKYRFEVGYGLEGALPDSFVGTLGRGILVPSFQAGRYLEGINGTIDVIGQALRGDLKPSSEDSKKTGDIHIDKSFIVLGIMLVIAAILDFVHFLLGGAAGLISGGIFSWFFIGHGFGNLALFAAIGFCAGMAARYIVQFGILLALDGGGGSSGSGGFSGGGGGFGGGGASGSW